MQFPSRRRSVLAATTLFLLLTGSYEIAVRWPHERPITVTALPSLLTSSASRAAVMLSRPGASVTAEPPVPLPTDAQLGYHRYVGTVGGRPVLAEVTLELQENSYPDTLLHAKWEGTFYYRATGLGSWLGKTTQFRPNQWLETICNQMLWGRYYGPTAVLCAEQPPGPLLMGYYTYPGQRQALPIYLRESYADGVRYELLHEESYGPARRHPDGTRNSAWVAQTYLHLLGADTLSPALARLQCPLPAARRRARLCRLRNLKQYDYYRGFVNITLNEGSLLAYTRDETLGLYGSRYDQEYSRCYLLDLRTSLPLLLATKLRPGKWRQMQRLLTRQILADTAAARHWLQAGCLPLPRAGFEVTTTGWRVLYTEPDDAEKSYTYSQELSWGTLRPLLRPTSPLHRLLRERKLP